MKHLNLTRPKGPLKISDFIVSQESNSFGDQILSLKQYESWTEDGRLWSGYKTIANDLRHEGDWMNLKEMKNWMKSVKKQKELL